MLTIKTDAKRLVLTSFLLFFVELTLIRWIGSQIYNLFFFSNLILMASFLGMGLGFLQARSAKNRFALSPFFFTFLIAAAFYCSFQYHVKVNPVTDNLDYSGLFFKNSLYPVWVTLPIVFIAVTFLMAMLANEVARQFQKFPPLQAYRLEILGSMLGILSFTLLSFSKTAPLSWGIVIILLFFLLLNKSSRLLFTLQMGFLAFALGIIALETFTPDHFWSSYYKVAVEEFSEKRYAVNVNGLTQQIIESVEQRKRVKPFYFLPYEYRLPSEKLDKVLIIGAGTGGDVAIALAQGAEEVDAVEIDPRLYQLGRKMNPDHPYADPRVHIYIDDGRAFLQHSKTQYDLIIFALTDSLALIHGQGSLRLENYLYTLEGISAVKDHLTSKGVFAIYSYCSLRWLVDRLAGTLTQVFNRPTCIDTYSPQDYWATVLTTGNTDTQLRCKQFWQPSKEGSVLPSTDDHPFIYLKNSEIPPIYLLTLGFILILSASLIHRLSGSLQVIKSNMDFFLMGAAFLLLETKSIVQFALLFGSTWFVNCLVFLGVLSTVYFSIEWANRFPIKHTLLLSITLFLMLFLAWKIPMTDLLPFSATPRFIAASFLTFSPIFLANLIFSQRFRLQAHSTEAFAANLLGAVFGGLLEYVSLLTGYQNLILFSAGLYFFALYHGQFRVKFV